MVQDLYDLLLTDNNDYCTCGIADEVRWEKDRLLVFISLTWLQEFFEGIENIFDGYLQEDYKANAVISKDCICIDLTELLDGCVSKDELKEYFKEGEE